MRLEFVAKCTDNQDILAHARLTARSGIFANLAIENYQIVREGHSLYIKHSLSEGRLSKNGCFNHRRANANEGERLAALNAFERRIIEEFARRLVGRTAIAGTWHGATVITAARVHNVTSERGYNSNMGALFAIELTMDPDGAVFNAFDTDIFSRLRPKPAPDTHIIRAKRCRSNK